MKIVAGLGCIDDYISYVEAGADEVFVGYVPYQWNQKYGILLPLNRREVQYYNVQLGAIEELKILKRMVDRYQVPVKITLNSLFYIEEQYEMIEHIIEECMEVGFDTFIIADPACILHLREQNIPCKIHFSGEIGEVNSNMMKQMNAYQITRYIFHRKNRIADMKSCIEKNLGNNLEYEAFVLNEWCHFTGGFCNSLHCDELTHLCKVPYQMAKIKESDTTYDVLFEQWKREEQQEEPQEEQVQEEQGYEERELEEQKQKQEQVAGNVMKENDSEKEELGIVGLTGCGLCAIAKLKAAGVTHLKLVGRGNHTEAMLRDIRVLKKALQILEEEKTEQYSKKMKETLFPHGCSKVCYYRGEI